MNKTYVIKLSFYLKQSFKHMLRTTGLNTTLFKKTQQYFILKKNYSIEPNRVYIGPIWSPLEGTINRVVNNEYL